MAAKKKKTSRRGLVNDNPFAEKTVRRKKTDAPAETQVYARHVQEAIDNWAKRDADAKNKKAEKKSKAWIEEADLAIHKESLARYTKEKHTVMIGTYKRIIAELEAEIKEILSGKAPKKKK